MSAIEVSSSSLAFILRRDRPMLWLDSVQPDSPGSRPCEYNPTAMGASLWGVVPRSSTPAWSQAQGASIGAALGQWFLPDVAATGQLAEVHRAGGQRLG